MSQSYQLEKELEQIVSQQLKLEGRIKDLKQKEKDLTDGPSGAATSSTKKRAREEDRTFLRSVVRREGVRRESLRDIAETRHHRSDAIQNGEKPILTSTIVATGPVQLSTGLTERPPTTVSEPPNEEIKKRNRKMFGVLVGTLESFKKEINTNSQVWEKRKEVEAKIDERVWKEKEDAISEQLKEVQKLKEKEEKILEDLNEKIEQKEKELLRERKEAHEKILSRFTLTKTKPSIYWIDSAGLQKLQASPSTSSSSTPSSSSTKSPPTTQESDSSKTSQNVETSLQTEKSDKTKDDTETDTKKESTSTTGKEKGNESETDTESDDQKDKKATAPAPSSDSGPSQTKDSPNKKTQEDGEEEGSDVENLPE